MRTFLIFLGLNVALRAQWIVNDPVNTAVNTAIQAGQAANHVEILRQWAASLEQLNAQLQQLQSQLEEQRRIRTVLGDPAAAGARVGTDALGSNELVRTFGETISALRRIAHAVDALHYTAEGIYADLEDRTVLGQSFTRQTAPYQRFAALESHADNVAAVIALTEPRRVMLQRDLGNTLQQLKSAATQAEVDKLQGKIAVLNSQLGAIDSQRRDASDQLRAQSALNANQAEKERQDYLEKQVADEAQAFSAVNAWQQAVKLTATEYTRP